MNPSITRRDFVQASARLAGAAALLQPLSSLAGAPRRTAVDQVPLGRTGVKISRLGIGTGTNGGSVQYGLGRATFNLLLQYAYDQGITWIDTAQNYMTHDWVGGAIRRLPRERLFIQTKISPTTEKPLETLDTLRQKLGVDYIDSVLLRSVFKKSWCEDHKPVMDALAEAQSRKIIRLKGVSCHTLPALRSAAQSDWCDVHLVRINPQATWIDGPREVPNISGDDIAPVLAEMKTMHAKGHGVIGMKIMGNGEFLKLEQRDRSLQFAMAQPDLDAIVVGFKATKEIDEAIFRINRALRNST